MRLSGKYYTLVTSKQDPAGVTMAAYLKDKEGFSSEGSIKEGSESFSSPLHNGVRLCISEQSLLYREDLDSIYPDATAFVFLSKHRSDSKIPTLTCHCTGNFADNPYGGNTREIAISYPYLQKEYLQTLTKQKPAIPDYEIVIEATHHGPTSLKKPVLFVELGSSEEQWQDGNAASVICRSILKVLSRPGHCTKVGIALGGTHYPTKFNKLLLESEFGLAAVASKHNLAAIDPEMLNQMIAKSIEKVTCIIVDRKGLGSEKDRIMKLAKSTGLEIVEL